MIRALVLALMICACEAQAEQASQHVVQPLSAAPPAGDNSARVSGTPDVAPTQVPATDAPSTAAPTASRKQSIDMFVSRDVLALSPDAAAARFASAYALKREAETPDGFLLVGSTPTEELNFDYVADGKGGFVCQQATLEYYIADPDESAALFREVEQQLRTKLGKPKQYPSRPETPYWKLVGRVQTSLSDHGSSRRTPNGRVVAIRISVPDGP